MRERERRTLVVVFGVCLIEKLDHRVEVVSTAQRAAVVVSTVVDDGARLFGGQVTYDAAHGFQFVAHFGSSAGRIRLPLHASLSAMHPRQYGVPMQPLSHCELFQ